MLCPGSAWWTQGFRIRLLGVGCRVWGVGFRFWVAGFRFQGSGCMVYGLHREVDALHFIFFQPS